MFVIEENIIFILFIIVCFFVGIILALLLLEYLEKQSEYNLFFRSISSFDNIKEDKDLVKNDFQKNISYNKSVEIDKNYTSSDIEIDNTVRNKINIEKDDKHKKEIKEDKSIKLLKNKLQKKLIKDDNENDLSEIEKKNIEKTAMDLVKRYEKNEGRKVKDVSMYYTGYDIKSTDCDKKSRFIEVKGKARSGKITLTVNEWNTAKKCRNKYYLYIVENISLNKPRLKIVQDPYSKLTAIETKFQYILSRNNYVSQANEIIPIDIKTD